MDPNERLPQRSVCCFLALFLHQKSHRGNNLSFNDFGGLLCSFRFSFGIMFDCFRCQIRNCFLIHRFSRFQKTHPFDVDLPISLGAAVALRTYNAWCREFWGAQFYKYQKQYCKTNGFYMVFLRQTSRFLISVLIYIYIYIYISCFLLPFQRAFGEGKGADRYSPSRFSSYFRFQEVTKMAQSRCVPCAALLSWTWRPGTDFGVIWGPKRSRDQFVSIRGSILTTFLIKCWWLGKGLASKNSNDNR